MLAEAMPVVYWPRLYITQFFQVFFIVHLPPWFTKPQFLATHYTFQC